MGKVAWELRVEPGFPQEFVLDGPCKVLVEEKGSVLVGFSSNGNDRMLLQQAWRLWRDFGKGGLGFSVLVVSTVVVLPWGAVL